jgi:hypothetical protein
VVTEALPRRHGWRVDHINSAPDAEAAFRRLCEWARAEFAKCERGRPEDADAFRWQAIHALAPLLAVVYKSRPDPEFRSCPKLPGGGWMPRRGRKRAGEARHP